MPCFTNSRQPSFLHINYFFLSKERGKALL